MEPKINYEQFKLCNIYQTKKAVETSEEHSSFANNKNKNISIETVLADKSDKKRKLNSHGHIIIGLIILLSFGITFLSANLITDGHIGKELLMSFNQEIFNSYYLVSSKGFNSYGDANNFSLLVRQQGAGGNIYEENKEYFVIYSPYLSKVDASSVSRKTANTIVKEIKIYNPKKNDLSTKTYEYAKKLNETRVFLVESIYNASVKLAKGEIDAEGVKNIVKSARNSALVLKSEIYNEKFSTKEKEYIFSKIDSLFGLTDTLTFYDELEIGKIRYCLTQLIITY